MNIEINGTIPAVIKSLGLGIFDGVHLGHQKLVEKTDVILTLSPHPKAFFQKKSLGYLTSLKERRHYIPQLLALSFTHDISQLSALSFLETIIWDKLRPQRLVVGYDYHFGYQKEGSPSFLNKWCQEKGIDLLVIPEFKMDGQSIKSGLIRTLIQTNSNQAFAYLGHPYLMIGEVVKGDGRGQSLGFPTANLAFDAQKIIPQIGVYKGIVTLDQVYNVLVNIGTKPTFGSHQKTVEVYIPGFSGSLYGQHLALHISEKIRDEQTFDSAEQLIEQIRLDLKQL